MNNNPFGANQNGVGPVFWTADRVEELRERWAAGESASIIADAFKTTRNAVIGKTKRLKLKARATTTKAEPGKGSKTKFAPKPRKPHVSIATRWGAYSVELTPGKVPETPVIDLPSREIPLLETRAFHCRWITSDSPALCCGRHTGFLGSWCPTHRAIVFQPKYTRRKAEAVEA